MKTYLFSIAFALILSLNVGLCDSYLIQDAFDEGKLDTGIWDMTIDGDFKAVMVDVVDIDPSDTTDFRLRLRASTLNTSTPMKYLGVRTRQAIDLKAPKTISFDIDWNDQQNGSYLSAALYICPTKSNNPRDEPNWIALEYTGVPPGRNLRTNFWVKANNSLGILYEDWGPRDQDNRPLGRSIGDKILTIRIEISGNQIRVFEDGNELFASSDHYIGFTDAFIYLQMSSGTNYPSREIYFDNFAVGHGNG